MRDSIAKSITRTVKDLNKSGLVDEITMKNIQNLCLPEVKEYSPEKIVSLRKKLKLSQAALASVFNISPSTVQKWESGHKKPTGALPGRESIVFYLLTQQIQLRVAFGPCPAGTTSPNKNPPLSAFGPDMAGTFTQQKPAVH